MVVEIDNTLNLLGFNNTDDFDTIFETYLSNKIQMIDHLLSNLTPVSDYFELDGLIADLMNYSWYTLDFQSGISLCNWLFPRKKHQLQQRIKWFEIR